MAKKIRALNADGDITWCSAEVMGARGCNHIAHGTEEEMETAQVKFFMSDSGLTSKIQKNDDEENNDDAIDEAPAPTIKDDKELLKKFALKERLEKSLKRGLTIKHLELLSGPDSDVIFMDSDYSRWLEANLVINDADEVTPEMRKVIEAKILTHTEDYVLEYVAKFLTNEKQLARLAEALLNNDKYYARHAIREICYNGNTPAKIIERILLADNIYTNGRVSHPNTPIYLIERAAEKIDLTDCYSSGDFVANPNTPAHVLRKFFPHLSRENPSGWEVDRMKRLISHPNFPADKLEQIITDEKLNRTYGSTALLNENLSIRHLETRASSPERSERASVASSSRATAEMLTILAKDDSYEVVESVIKNKNTSPNTLRSIYDSVRDGSMKNKFGDWGFRMENIERNLASNPKTPTDVLKKMLEDNPIQHSRVIAANIGINEDMIKELLKSKYRESDVLYALASNVSAPTALLHKFAQKNKYIAKRVADNPKAALKTLEFIYDTHPESAHILTVIAGHKNASPQLLSKVLEEIPERMSKTDEVRWGWQDDGRKRIAEIKSLIARNPNANSEVLAQITDNVGRTKSQDIKLDLVQYGSNISIESLRKIARSKGIRDEALAKMYVKLLEGE